MDDTSNTLEIENTLAYAKTLARPGLRLRPTRDKQTSYLGGVPALPAGFHWPDHEGVPLDFIACLDLAAIRQAGGDAWLPATGTLLFFYDLQVKPWGFDPADRSRRAVIFLPASRAKRQPTFPSAITPLRRKNILFEPFECLPGIEHLAKSTGVASKEAKAALLKEQRAAFAFSRHHHMGGWPIGCEEDEGMERECQLASHDIYCGKSPDQDGPEALALLADSSKWQLLLQLDGSDAFGSRWGSSGQLYFWVEEDNAKAGNFQDAWAIARTL